MRFRCQVLQFSLRRAKPQTRHLTWGWESVYTAGLRISCTRWAFHSGPSLQVTPSPPRLVQGLSHLVSPPHRDGILAHQALSPSLRRNSVWVLNLKASRNSPHISSESQALWPGPSRLPQKAGLAAPPASTKPDGHWGATGHVAVVHLINYLRNSALFGAPLMGLVF